MNVTAKHGQAAIHLGGRELSNGRWSPACDSVGDGWTISEDNKTYVVDGQTFTLSNMVNCRKCSRKYGC